MEGSLVRKVNDYIALSCMSEEARDLLNTIMADWEPRAEAMREQDPTYEPTVYDFAYWLCRYSGLIQPATSQAVDAGASHIKPDGTFERVTEKEAAAEE